VFARVGWKRSCFLARDGSGVADAASPPVLLLAFRPFPEVDVAGGPSGSGGEEDDKTENIPTKHMTVSISAGKGVRRGAVSLRSTSSCHRGGGRSGAPPPPETVLSPDVP